MVLHRDLKVLHASNGNSPSRVLAVGWLEGSIPRSGATPERFQTLLGRSCSNPPPVSLTFRFQPCEFGRCRQWYKRRKPFIAGNGEIYVPGREGVSYNAPMLISHYVSGHNYRPP